MDKEEELDWINSSQRGDLAAFGKLAAKYQDMIYTLAMRILKNQHDAKDLSQEVLIKMFRSLPQYQRQSPFGAWVYRITYNESINKIRKSKRNRETKELNDNINWVETKNALIQLEASERKAIIIDAIGHLNESDRFLIMAFYFEELSIKELSKITNLTASNIKIKLHRSRKVLSTILDRELINESIL